MEDIWILEEDRTPTSAGASFGMMGGGVILALFGAYLFRPKKRPLDVEHREEPN